MSVDAGAAVLLDASAFKATGFALDAWPERKGGLGPLVLVLAVWHHSATDRI